MADSRQRKTDRRRGKRISVDPAVRARWNQAYKLSRYGLTQEQSDRLLEAQEYACGMCGTAFKEEQAICIDHDHACCPDEKSSCGKCARGLLCLSCNTALGIIERKSKMTRAYLGSPPGQLVMRAGQAA